MKKNRTAVATCAGFSFFVIHDIERLDIDPKAAGMHAVIHGHTHHADISWEDGVLYLNPGSVSRPRSGPGPSLAIIEIRSGQLHPSIVYKPE